MPVDLELFHNSVGAVGAGTLASDPGTAGVTLTLTAGHGARFPAVVAGQRLRLQCDDEVMICTAHTASADTFTVTREQEGTTAAAHAIAAEVNVVLTAEAHRRWLPEYAWQPRLNGLLIANMEPVIAHASALIGTTLVPYLVRVFVPETMSFANLLMGVGSAGATLTAGSNEAGVYSSAGVLIGRTASQATAWTTTGLKTMALTAEPSQSLTVTGGPGVFVWLAAVASGGTRPGFSRLTSGDSYTANAGLAAADGYARGSLAAVTAGNGLPASFAPATALNASSVNYWMAAS